MEGILTFNKHLLFLSIVIILFVGWLLFCTVYYFVEFNNKYNSKFVHSKELEIFWTSVPALILLMLATPFFTLLYAMDEIAEPELSLKILGHQWFWSYEISDFNSCQKNEQNLKYVCYMMVLGFKKNYDQIKLKEVKINVEGMFPFEQQLFRL